MDRESSPESQVEERDDQPQDQVQEEEGHPPKEEEATEGGADSSGDKAGQVEQEVQEAKEEVKRLEEDPPEKLEDWPTGQAMYETFGGPEGEHGYHQGPEQKLGPSDVRHREDGQVELEGEKVEKPEEFKGEPIKGGPTDPNTPNLRMDKAAPEDRSEIARRAAGEEEEGSDQGDEEESGGDER